MDARAHWQDEMQSAWLYRQLAKAESEALPESALMMAASPSRASATTLTAGV